MEECPVCFEPTEHRLGACGHAVCASCIRKWPKGTCPVCRRLVEESDRHGSRLRVEFRPGMFHGRIMTLSQDACGVRFRWKARSPEPADASSPRLLQEQDVITHIDGFEVGGVERAASTFVRLMSTSCMFTCHVRRP